jgi:hypothetical protein
MSKIRKQNAKRTRSKPRKTLASKPRVAKNLRKRGVDVSSARKKVTQAWATGPSLNLEPSAVAAVERDARRKLPFLFWTRMPFAIMDIWFSTLGREDKRTGGQARA